jgi:hypothetical protein
MSELPGWLRPLVGAVAGSAAEDYLRVGAPAPPPGGGGAGPAVLILLGEGRGRPGHPAHRAGPERLRQHAGQPAFPGRRGRPGDTGPGGHGAARVGRGGRAGPGRRPGRRAAARALPAADWVSSSPRCWPGGTPRPRSAWSTAAEVARVERVPVASWSTRRTGAGSGAPPGTPGPRSPSATWWCGGSPRRCWTGCWSWPAGPCRGTPTDVRALPQRARDLARRGVSAGAPGGPQRPDPAGPDDGPAAEDVRPADEHGDLPAGCRKPGRRYGPARYGRAVTARAYRAAAGRLAVPTP